MSMRCAHAWCERQLCWRVVTDAWGTTNLPGVAVAGDAADIGGAVCAEHRGVVAALGAVRRLGLISERQRDSRAAPHRRIMIAENRFRRFLDVLFRPSRPFLVPRDPSVLACRCEEISAGKLRETITLGCEGPNQLKSFTRCGMGPCQGRMCGLTVAHILSAQLARSMAEVGYYRLRQPIKPIGLGELAAMAHADAYADARPSSQVASS
jgi:NADPH-dependent 2,4-dienoyl-CoA reductase/sulfur reductase-like enzyme